jgi:hypothetical protein
MDWVGQSVHGSDMQEITHLGKPVDVVKGHTESS